LVCRPNSRPSMKSNQSRPADVLEKSSTGEQTKQSGYVRRKPIESTNGGRARHFQFDHHFRFVTRLFVTRSARIRRRISSCHSAPRFVTVVQCRTVPIASIRGLTSLSSLLFAVLIYGRRSYPMPNRLTSGLNCTFVRDCQQTFVTYRANDTILRYLPSVVVLLKPEQFAAAFKRIVCRVWAG
jgi:hypothetical protein